MKFNWKEEGDKLLSVSAFHKGAGAHFHLNKIFLPSNLVKLSAGTSSNKLAEAKPVYQFPAVRLPLRESPC